MQSIFVNICENNDQGNRSGKVTHFWFAFEDGEMFLNLECKFFEGVEITTEGIRSKIIMYGHEINALSILEWAGNMMWNEYKLSASSALGFINLLMHKKDFTLAEAWSAIAKKWDEGIEITAADIELPEDIVAEIHNPHQLELFQTSNNNDNERPAETKQS